MEINAADVRGIDGMRSIINRARYQMLGAERTVYIFDECHQLTKDSQNSLLKILEEPPAHVYFILCTTNPEKIIKTIRTRCIEMRFKPADNESIGELILRIIEREELPVSDKIAAKTISNSSGSPRLALNLLETCVNADEGEDVDSLLSGLQLDNETVNANEFALATELLKRIDKGDNTAGILRWFDERVLKTNADTKGVLIGLKNKLGKRLLYGRSASLDSISDAILELENSENLYSNAANMAIVYRTVTKLGA